MKINLSFEDLKAFDESAELLETVTDTTFQEKLVKIQVSLMNAKKEVYDTLKTKIEKFESLKLENEDYIKKIDEINKKFAIKNEAGEFVLETIIGADKKESQVYTFDEKDSATKEKEMDTIRTVWVPLLQELQDLQKEIETEKVAVNVEFFRNQDKSRNFNKIQLQAYNRMKQENLYELLKRQGAAE